MTGMMTVTEYINADEDRKQSRKNQYVYMDQDGSAVVQQPELLAADDSANKSRYHHFCTECDMHVRHDHWIRTDGMIRAGRLKGSSCGVCRDGGRHNLSRYMDSIEAVEVVEHVPAGVIEAVEVVEVVEVAPVPVPTQPQEVIRKESTAQSGDERQREIEALRLEADQSRIENARLLEAMQRQQAEETERERQAAIRLRNNERLRREEAQKRQQMQEQLENERKQREKEQAEAAVRAAKQKKEAEEAMLHNFADRFMDGKRLEGMPEGVFVRMLDRAYDPKMDEIPDVGDAWRDKYGALNVVMSFAPDGSIEIMEYDLPDTQRPAQTEEPGKQQAAKAAKKDGIGVSTDDKADQYFAGVVGSILSIIPLPLPMMFNKFLEIDLPQHTFDSAMLIAMLVLVFNFFTCWYTRDDGFFPLNVVHVFIFAIIANIVALALLVS